MLKNGFSLLILFAMSAGVSVAFQNCGGSTIKANKSENGGLEVVVAPGEDPTGTDDVGDVVNENFSFSLANGDNIYYVDDALGTPRYNTVRLYAALYDTILETRIYSETVVDPDFELPTKYCATSALAHCEYQRTSTCQGTNCPPNRPVECVSQRQLENPEISSTFTALNSLKFLTRSVQADDPVASCDTSLLSFIGTDQTLRVALTDRQCVAEGGYYASEGGPELLSILNSELTSVQGRGQLCNDYSVYAWNTTTWKFKSQSGFQADSQFREVDFDNGIFKVKWKNSGDSKTYCVDRMGAQNQNDHAILGFDIFFPDAGLPYRVMLTNQQLADAPTAEITYTDPIDEGLSRRFFLDEMSATSNRGGAILASGVAQAMKNHIESLISRAVSLNIDEECP